MDRENTIAVQRAYEKIIGMIELHNPEVKVPIITHEFMIMKIRDEVHELIDSYGYGISALIVSKTVEDFGEDSRYCTQLMEALIDYIKLRR